MRVVMVTAFPEAPDRIASGPAGVGLNLARALAALPDLDLEIVVPLGIGGKEHHARFDGFTVHYLPGRGPASPAFRYLWTTPRAIARKLAMIDHDIVHIQNWANFLPRSGKPSVLTIHGILERDILYRGRLRWIRSKIMEWTEMRARGRARDLILVSPYVREILGTHLFGRTWDIDNPVADRFFDVERRPVSGRVLFVGRLTPLKNVTGMIAGFSILAGRDPSVELRVAGGDSGSGYAEECRNVAERLGVGGRVAFLGPVGAEQLFEELSTASGLVLFSFQENAPMVVGEAMAAGVPVVASRVGGIPSMVEDGVTGRLVDPKDPARLADALEEVMRPDPGERMSSQSRLVAGERFRASVVAGKTYEVYREILRESARATGSTARR